MFPGIPSPPQLLAAGLLYAETQKHNFQFLHIINCSPQMPSRFSILTSADKPALPLRVVFSRVVLTALTPFLHSTSSCCKCPDILLLFTFTVSGKWKHVTACAGDSTADHRFIGRKSPDHSTEEAKPGGKCPRKCWMTSLKSS